MGILEPVFAEIWAVFFTVRPILEEVPEEKRVVTRLSGGIELNNVSFRYQEDMPMILDNLSLKIRPGQYDKYLAGKECWKNSCTGEAAESRCRSMGLDRKWRV